MVKKLTVSQKITASVLSALLIAVIVTISSGWLSTFAKAEQVQKLEIRTNEKINKAKTRITILETNYDNIITHLEEIKANTSD